MKLPKSKYKNVTAHLSSGKYIVWSATFTLNGKFHQKWFKLDEEKEAAKWVDIQRIRNGKEPINILVKKCI